MFENMDTCPCQTSQPLRLPQRICQSLISELYASRGVIHAALEWKWSAGVLQTDCVLTLPPTLVFSAEPSCTHPFIPAALWDWVCPNALNRWGSHKGPVLLGKLVSCMADYTWIPNLELIQWMVVMLGYEGSQKKNRKYQTKAAFNNVKQLNTQQSSANGWQTCDL